jgi:hypothetical protein
MAKTITLELDDIQADIIGFLAKLERRTPEEYVKQATFETVRCHLADECDRKDWGTVFPAERGYSC